MAENQDKLKRVLAKIKEQTTEIERLAEIQEILAEDWQGDNSKWAAECLAAAALRGNNQILEFLLDNGFDVNSTTLRKQPATAIHILASETNEETKIWDDDTLEILLDHNADCFDDLNNYSAFSAAIINGHTTIVRELFTRLQRLDGNRWVSKKHSPLPVQATEYYAAWYRTKSGLRPLHHAAQYGRQDICEILFYYGASLHLPSPAGKTPLHYALDKEHVSVAEFLLSHLEYWEIAEQLEQLKPGSRALHAAAEQGNVMVAKELLKHSILGPTDLDSKNFTPILAAIAATPALDTAKFSALRSCFETTISLRIQSESEKPFQKACKESEAILVEFPGSGEPKTFRNANIWQLVYTRKGSFVLGEGHEYYRFKKTVEDQNLDQINQAESSFMWLNLPANNNIWLRDLLTAACLDFGAGFKSIIPHIADTYHLLDENYSRSRLHDGRPKPSCELNFPNWSQKPPFGVICMPYLSWQSIEEYEFLSNTFNHRTDKNAITPMQLSEMTASRRRDTLLIRTYGSRNAPTLYLPQTLDGFRYPALKTQSRDLDQVVFRYDKSQGKAKNDRRIFMVDQLWLYILPGIVFSCIPERENKPVQRWILDDSQLKENQHPLALATTILDNCAGFFDHRYPTDDSSRLFEAFEMSSVQLTDEAHKSYEKFQSDLRHVRDWLEQKRSAGRITRSNTEGSETPPSTRPDMSFIDSLVDISSETGFHFECVDIQDELDSLSLVLKHQVDTVAKVLGALIDINLDQSETYLRDNVYHRLRQTKERLERDQEDIKRVGDQVLIAKGIFSKLLEMKTRYANVIEARFSRESAENTARQAKETAEQTKELNEQTAQLRIQAEETARQAKETERQGKTLMVFTIVTIIFLPLSFLASVFALDPSKFPWQGDDLHNLNWAFRYLFGISIGFSVFTILIAWNVEILRGWWEALLRHLLPKPTAKNAHANSNGKDEREIFAHSSGADLSDSSTISKLNRTSTAHNLEAGQAMDKSKS